MKVKDESEVILNPELGSDGVYRVTFSTYSNFRTRDDILKLFNSQTGIEWMWFGTYMDVSCVGTHDPKAASIQGMKVTI